MNRYLYMDLTKYGRCNSCEDLYINGVKCHESGCPDAWKDEIRKCRWCGREFKPADRLQKFCCGGCFCDYYNIPREDDLNEDCESPDLH